MKEKTYTICTSLKGKNEYFEGTVEQLTEMFSEILREGNELNPKIKTQPKDIKQLLTAIQKSYTVIEFKTYSKTFVDLAE